MVLKKQLINRNQLSALAYSVNLTYTELDSYLNFTLKLRPRFYLNVCFMVFYCFGIFIFGLLFYSYGRAVSRARDINEPINEPVRGKFSLCDFVSRLLT